VRYLTFLVVAALLTFSSEIRAEEAMLPSAPRLENPLAFRLSNYGKYAEAAWNHLPSIGIHFVFANVPDPGDAEDFQEKLRQHGLTPLVLRGNADLGRESCVDELAVQLATCQKMGVKYMFFSAKHSNVSKETAYERLRRAGDIAQKNGVVIALETHPDLGTNAAAHLETMRRIHHPNVRVNFDTGNITFYNRGLDAAEELEKIIDYVATVEFKDHDGKLESWNFPILGTGVVRFPEVVRVLEKHRFHGPITIEVEGFKDVVLDEAQTKKYIADSVSFVKSLGNFR